MAATCAGASDQRVALSRPIGRVSVDLEESHTKRFHIFKYGPCSNIGSPLAVGNLCTSISCLLLRINRDPSRDCHHHTTNLNSTSEIPFPTLSSLDVLDT
mmetsp:Transcript_12560/g.29113  ORF Transcript_12560/g.29113 Transcript_12560/m.29113 type:complete len:100 (+) Transcript_12560:386-685(+)